MNYSASSKSNIGLKINVLNYDCKEQMEGGKKTIVEGP